MIAQCLNLTTEGHIVNQKKSKMQWRRTKQANCFCSYTVDCVNRGSYMSGYMRFMEQVFVEFHFHIKLPQM